MKNKSKIVIWVASLLIISLTIVFGVLNRNTEKVSPVGSNNVVSIENKKTDETTNNKYKETTIKIGTVGDILIHSPIFRSVYDAKSNSYDFNDIFKYVNDVYSSYDLMVADLEQPLGGD